MATLNISSDSVRAAAQRIASGIQRTPASFSRALSAVTGADVTLKIETRQTTGSYKERGALNAMLMLGAEQRERGVVTMSAGNHGQAVAYHGMRLGIGTTVVMPQTTPFLKIRRTRDFGATVVLTGDTFDEAADYARSLAERTGATIVHPYDDAQVIAGQGTATLELLEDGGDFDVLLVPVGGGGLIAGAVLAAMAANSRAEVVAVQSAFYPSIVTARDGLADGVGGPTIAEGIAVKRMGALPLAVIRDVVREVITVSEAAIETAIVTLIEEEKLVSEGAGAAGVAALLADPGRFTGLRVGTLVCGGNIDPGMLASVIVRHRMRSGRVIRIRVHMVDKPGELAAVATAISAARANVLDVTHHRVFGSISAKHAELDLTVEVERPEDVKAIMASLKGCGFDAEVVTE
ncbi:MAG: threonine ammonia-lyase [Candidatus Velthaea sp.]|jgi:threonine dehydratase